MAYIIKWIPKDQDVVIDRTKRFDTLMEAIAVARNLLQLSPKKIWIEDENGVVHIEHWPFRNIPRVDEYLQRMQGHQKVLTSLHSSPLVKTLYCFYSDFSTSAVTILRFR
jgi:hypothetical protein